METLHIHISTRPRPLVYHFAWGPMRCKPVLVGCIAERLAHLLLEKAEALGIELRRVQIQPALVYLAVEAPPTVAPHSIACGLKAHSSSVLRREFKELTTIPTLWTRDYLVAAGEDVSTDDLLRVFIARLGPRRPPGRPRCYQP
jgi:REP-associated tyrosine transposase